MRADPDPATPKVADLAELIDEETARRIAQTLRLADVALRHPPAVPSPPPRHP